MQIGKEKSIFLEALEFAPDRREGFLQEACRGDADLLASVRELLGEHSCEHNLVDEPIASLPNLRSREDLYLPGTLIGPYTLREQIGEGGFGLVFFADQETPVRRRVALKIIKPGMESQEVLARFEAERQALALMDHPNIARVIDAGMTDSAQPYFVMELVRGVQLCQFCDQHQLSTRERLRLFKSICNAVQHAHQKGIIHRDLKPSNVLVTMLDGQPIPKVIDFGVAKAIGQSLTGKTIYTRFTAMIGTPAYMSPEQAEMSAVDIDTRADIYSLGVLLYELLTGSTPFTRDRLDSAGFDELREIIRTEEPPPPSTRLSTLSQQVASTVSSARQVEPSKLKTLLQGDLDWIVMRAIDKDRNRRYPTAESLADDITNYLDDEPVVARPPSSLYRFSKFARRNKVTLTTATLVAASLILGTIISVWQAGLAQRESREKERALDRSRSAEARVKSLNDDLEQFTERLKQANIMLASGRAHADSERWSQAYSDYTNATQLQPKYYHVWVERARFYIEMGLWKQAADDFATALELGAPVSGPEWCGVAELFWLVGDKASYQLLCNVPISPSYDEFRTAFAIRGRLVGELTDKEASDLATQTENFSLVHKSQQNDGTSAAERIPGTMPVGPARFVAGWAQYRASNWQHAIERLEAAKEDERWSGRDIVMPLIAMAHKKLGQDEDAAASLAESQAFIDQHLNRTLDESLTKPEIPWFDWVDLLINHREAHILITGRTPMDDPRIRELEKLAHAAIRDDIQ